jgi:hypothetical protein
MQPTVPVAVMSYLLYHEMSTPATVSCRRRHAACEALQCAGYHNSECLAIDARLLLLLRLVPLLLLLLLLLPQDILTWMIPDAMQAQYAGATGAGSTVHAAVVRRRNKSEQNVSRMRS